MKGQFSNAVPSEINQLSEFITSNKLGEIFDSKNGYDLTILELAERLKVSDPRDYLDNAARKKRFLENLDVVIGFVKHFKQLN